MAQQLLGEMATSTKESSSVNAGRRLPRKMTIIQTLFVLSLAMASQKCEVVHANESVSSGTSFSTSNSANDDLLVSEDRAIETIHDNLLRDILSSPTNLDDDEATSEMDDIIVVVAVDGTLAGISKSSGKLIWKQQSQKSSEHGKKQSSTNNKPGRLNMQQGKPQVDNVGETAVERLLRPLVSTTTTTQSAASSDYAAVPSLDGNVYLTSHVGTGVPPDTSTTKESSITISTSIKELAQRAPFLDPKGRIYAGSRQATVAALDRQTGEILNVITTKEDENMRTSESPQIAGRSVIWIGKVEHSVTVQDARTGNHDASFSFTEVMSLVDLQAGSNLLESKGTTGELSRLTGPNRKEKDYPGDGLFLGQSSETTENIKTRLISTPSGNIGLTHEGSGQLQWVADVHFDTPIAFAMDATTGHEVGVDIIPDVTLPSSEDLNYLSREIERQLEMISSASNVDTDESDQQTIVGRLQGSGQLYALPLGSHTRRTMSAIGGTTPAIHNHNSLLSATAQHAKVPPRTASSGRSAAHFPHQNKENGIHESSSMTKVCQPTSSHFPACLVDHHKHKTDRDFFFKPKPRASLNDHEESQNTELALIPITRPGSPFTSQYQEWENIYTDPNSYSYSPPPKRPAMLKIFAWWLPPTILSIFVLSFELGRRKRLRDESATKDDKAKGTNDEDIISRDTDQSNDEVDSSKDQHIIQVSDEVLGYGGQGTVVYKGALDGRAVAVKRMLKAYHANADREIRLLIESDGHPNVVRYFLKEQRGDFVYLALELCDVSLHDLIGVLRVSTPSIPLSATRTVLYQIACGVKHLHSLRIVHRDLKPANILLAIEKRGKKGNDTECSVYDNFVNKAYIAKISDMGLGKQIAGQSSLGGSMAISSAQGTKGGASSIGVGPGSVGWQAPEVMALRWASSEMSAKSEESNNGNGDTSLPDFAPPSVRTSRSVDIFALGCIFYSTLLPGNHPFGEWYERESNIMHNRPAIAALEKVSFDAFELVRAMLQRNPILRPTAKQICKHPYFWSPQEKLAFLCEFSDRLETDTTEQTTISLVGTLAIERDAANVVGSSWDSKLDEPLIQNMRRYRTYDPCAVRDLLRLIRNKHHHFDELPEDFRISKVCDQDALLEYFDERFPRLVMHCWNCCREVLPENDPLVLKYGIPPFPKVTNQCTVSPHTRSVVSKVDEDEQEELNDNGPDPADQTGGLGQTADLPKDGKVSKTGVTAGLSLSATIAATPRDAVNGVDPPPNIIPWEGSAAARVLNCRGWSRSEHEWVSHIDPCFRKKDPNLKRALTDPKYRTRLCNHWDSSFGTFCPMRKKNKCVFAHGPAELRVKDGKKNRWGKLVDKNGDNTNPFHSGGEDTFGAARNIESVRQGDGRGNTGKAPSKSRKPSAVAKKKTTNVA